MLLNIYLPLILAMNFFAQRNQQLVKQLPDDKKDISIELRFAPGQLKDSGILYVTPVEYIKEPANVKEQIKINNGRYHFNRKLNGPVYFGFSKILKGSQLANYFAEPGDNVVIQSNGERLIFSGEGAMKYQLQYELDSADKTIEQPKTTKTGPALFYLDSLGEFNAWRSYYQKKMDLAIPVFYKYEDRIPATTFNFLKDAYIEYMIQKLNDKFYSMKTYGFKRKKLSATELVRLYDNYYIGLIAQWAAHATDREKVEFRMRQQQIQRVFLFDEKRMPAEIDIHILLFKDMLKIYKGKERERYIIGILPEIMGKKGFTPEVEQLLTDYYAETEYPEWKIWMKERELKIRKGWIAQSTPRFTLVDIEGRFITDKEFKGKFAVLSFQNEKTQDKNTAIVLDKAIKQFANHPAVVFINISVEKNNATWKKRVLASRYTAKNIIYAYTGGSGTDHPVIRDYAVTTYPAVWVVDSTGKVANLSPRIDFTGDNGEQLAAFIQQRMNYFKAEQQKRISITKDGPYVIHESNAVTAFSIDNNNLTRITVEKPDQQQLKVQTDLDKTFSVNLQSSIHVQPSIYPASEKLIAFSDIEGNFDALRRLLQNNKVIDGNFNWIFGKGHLVFAGDMFDRGNQVTECLWLMYSLEEKAKAAGGYVHFVLGNHEIMNMQGDHYYATKKYKSNAALLGKTLTELCNEDSELGRWLRTKNVIEKIGDLLFVHGGISPEVNRLPLGVEDINRIARPYYGKIIDSSNTTVLALYNTKYGEKYRVSPFWSRGYYKKKSNGLISDEQLDSTLSKFAVRRIVTGHTIIADTVSVHYTGRVLNTDTKHAAGKSEALLIEGDRFYRVNAEGKRVLLFIDNKKKLH